MPTPSFEKRLRRRSGQKVHFTYKTSTGSKRSVTTRVKRVEWNDSANRYEFIGSSPSVRVPTNRMIRPVRSVSSSR